MARTPPEWVVGYHLPELDLPPVDRLTLIRYAGASGDYNPIHTIDAEAHAAGLPGLIQHGMLTMAEMGTLLTPYMGHGFIEKLQTRFVGMLFLGDVLRITARVTLVEPTDHDVVRFGFDLQARTIDKRLIAKGSLRFLWFAEP
jgi:acyl dehydratase